MFNPSNLPDKSVIEADINYAFTMCQSHYFPFIGIENIKGAHICEIGTGKNLGIALLFKSLGAKTVYTVDKYPTAWNDEYHPVFYKEFLNFILDKFPQANRTIFDEYIASKGCYAPALYTLEEDAELLPSIPNKSIDFICSWAVLEHLYDPPKAFARFSEITKTGGKGIHQVDFRDHHDFMRPLEFLLHYFRVNEELKKESYDWIAKRLNRSDANELGSYGLIRRHCGYWGNSFRAGEYDNLWKKNSFNILSFEANSFAEQEYLDDFIPRLIKANTPYVHINRDELLTLSGLYKVELV